MENKTAEESAKELGKQKAEKIYPVVTTHNWYQKENAAYRNGFEDGHTYASLQCAEMKEENERLKNWKESMLEIWSPVIDWGQSKEAGLRPGADITAEALRRAKAYPELQEEVERLKRTLHMANQMLITYEMRYPNDDGCLVGRSNEEARSIIEKALSGKESKTE